MILINLSLLALVIILCLYGLTLVFYALLRQVNSSQLNDSELPFVSILVPARNEETKIARCLDSLLKQNYPNFEIVVIDDRSTDLTGEIIQKFAQEHKNIKFVQGKDAPNGWIGKCNALAHASGYASGDWFVFTDADTCHAPNSVRDSVSYAMEHQVDLLSFVPMQELGSFWERLVMPALLSSFLIGDPFHSVNDPKAERAYAYGQYILCRRTSYLAVGGHRSVHNEIVEDHALARVFKEKGYKIAVADGKTLYSVRMYTNLQTLWLGWTKNLYSLIDSRLINLSIILFFLHITQVLPYVLLGTLISMFLSGENLIYAQRLAVVVAAQFVVLFFWFRRTSDHHAGITAKHFFLLPFGALAVTILYLHATYLVLGGGQVNWKGRRYRVNTFKTIMADGEIRMEHNQALVPDISE